ncbi:MAG: hypothetical protein KC619_00590 [Myxococcales bacterium]|nr:hypothetical protein [Myxococcales bacterium]
MATEDTQHILRAVEAALDAANAWRGERWYEPADVELALRFGGDVTPAVAGWQARLGDVEVWGAATAVIALETLRDVFTNSAASRETKR